MDKRYKTAGGSQSLWNAVLHGHRPAVLSFSIWAEITWFSGGTEKISRLSGYYKALWDHVSFNAPHSRHPAINNDQSINEP